MIKTLREEADKNNIFIGAAVNTNLLDKDRDYTNLLKTEFNMVVPENAMKWHTLRPEKDVFDFVQADKLVSFAEENKMAVRGHTLVWGATMPDWFNKLSPGEMNKSLEEHINKVVGRYKGKIYAWDVVNEAFDDSGEYADSHLIKSVGPKYTEKSFRLAKKADPTARLFWNEWGADCINKRSDRFYELVKTLLLRNVPIEGVGFQMHTGLGRPKTTTTLPDIESVRENFERFAKLGLEIHITEMDVQIQEAEGLHEEKLKKEARFYGDIMSMVLQIPQFKALLQWGVNDKYSWVSTWLTHKDDAPLMFDKDNKPKLAYYAVKKALGNNIKLHI